MTSPNSVSGSSIICGCIRVQSIHFIKELLLLARALSVVVFRQQGDLLNTVTV
jgi:hypothetical protein